MQIFKNLFKTTIGNDLTTVKPSAKPMGKLFYVDFKYSSIKEFRKIKLNKLNRRDKLKYIDNILKNN
jgi:hypothetical protein